MIVLMCAPANVCVGKLVRDDDEKRSLSSCPSSPVNVHPRRCVFGGFVWDLNGASDRIWTCRNTAVISWQLLQLVAE